MTTKTNFIVELIGGLDTVADTTKGTTLRFEISEKYRIQALALAQYREHNLKITVEVLPHETIGRKAP